MPRWRRRSGTSRATPTQSVWWSTCDRSGRPRYQLRRPADWRRTCGAWRRNRRSPPVRGSLPPALYRAAPPHVSICPPCPYGRQKIRDFLARLASQPAKKFQALIDYPIAMCIYTHYEEPGRHQEIGGGRLAQGSPKGKPCSVQAPGPPRACHGATSGTRHTYRHLTQYRKAIRPQIEVSHAQLYRPDP
jgi:hypothetical protein